MGPAAGPGKTVRSKRKGPDRAVATPGRGRTARAGPIPISPAEAARGNRYSPAQAASGLENFSAASVMRAEIGAKDASASFSAASCSFAVSEKDFSIAARA